MRPVCSLSRDLDNETTWVCFHMEPRCSTDVTFYSCMPACGTNSLHMHTWLKCDLNVQRGSVKSNIPSSCSDIPRFSGCIESVVKSPTIPDTQSRKTQNKLRFLSVNISEVRNGDKLVLEVLSFQVSVSDLTFFSRSCSHDCLLSLIF